MFLQFIEQKATSLLNLRRVWRNLSLVDSGNEIERKLTSDEDSVKFTVATNSK